MKNFKISILMVFILMIFLVSAVSAADVDDSVAISVDNDAVDEIQSTSDTEIIADDDDGNFTSLQTLIDGEENEITLDKNYTRVEGDSDITISKDFTINGDNHKIDASNLGRIFKVNTGSILTLKNLTLINGASENGSAIYTNGKVIIENCNFSENGANAIYIPVNSYKVAVITDEDKSQLNISFEENFIGKIEIKYNGESKFNDTLTAKGSYAIYNFSDINLDADKFDEELLEVTFIEGILDESNVYIVKDNETFNAAYNGSDSPLGKYYAANPREDGVDKDGNYVTDPETEIVNHTWDAAQNAPGSTVPWVVLNMDNFTGRLIFLYFKDQDSCWIWDVKNKNYGIVSIIAKGDLETPVAEFNETALKVYFAGFSNTINSPTFTIKTSDSNAEIKNSIFKDNGGESDNAIYNLGTLKLEGNIISNNIYNGGLLSAKATPQITDLINIIKFNETLTFTVTMTDKAKGNITIYVDDVENQTIDLDDNYSNASVTIQGLGVNTHTINVTYNGNENYEVTNVSFEVTVNKSASSISITPIANVTYGNNVSVSFTSENTTKVTYTVTKGEKVIETNETSEKTITLTNLAAGNYTITINVAESGNYTGSSASEVFTVDKANTSVSIDPIENVTYSKNFDVTFTFENATEVTYTVTKGEEVIETNETSQKTISLSYLDVGNYTITINVAESENYTGSSASQDFTINKAASSVSIDSIKNVTYGNNVIITFSYNTATNVTYTVTKGEVVIETNETSENPINLTNLAAGNYTITINVPESKNYNSSSASQDFTVDKAASSVSIDPIANVTYGNNVSVSYTLENATEVTYTVSNGEEVIETNETSEKTITLKDLAAGNYTITINALESENYTASSASGNFTVEKGDYTLNVTVEDVVYPNVAIAYVEASVDGNYTLTISPLFGATPYTVEVINKKGNVTLRQYGIGEYTLNVTLDNDNYNENYNTTTLKVRGNNTLSVSVEDTEYPINATVTVTADVDGEYIVNVNDKNYTVVVDNGVGNTTIDVLYVGEYNVTLSFDNDTYINKENSTTFNVTKGINTLSVEVAETEFNKNATVNVYASADGEYKVTVNGTDYEVEVKDGVGNVTIKLLDIGNYTVNLTFDDGNYTNFENSTELSIVAASNTLTINVSETEYPNNATVYVEASADGTYTLNVNTTDKNYTVEVTDGKGNVTLDVLTVGEYTLTLTFDNENYTEHSNVTTLTIATGSNTLSVVIENVDASTNATAIITASVDGTYNLTVNQKDYEVTVTSGTGQVVLDLLDVGTYTATLTYETELYKNTENTTTFKVASSFNNLSVSIENIVYGQNATAKINASVNGEYTLTVDEIVYNVTVENNTAEVNITGLNAGNYTAILTLVNSTDYTSSQNSTEFTVSKIVNTLNLTIDNVTYPGNVTVNVAASVDGNYTLTLNGANYTVDVVNSAGVYNLSGLAAGEYSITVTFEDIINYENPTNTSTFKVNRKENTLTISVENTTYPDNVTFKVTASEDGLYYITVNGETYEVNVNNGTANYTLPLSVGTYNVTLTFSDSENYTAYENTSEFSVLKGEVDFNISVDNTKFGEDIILNLTTDTEGYYGVTIYDTQYIYSLSADVGNNTLTLPMLSVGEYEVEVRFVSSSQYNQTTKTTKFNVTKNDINLTVESEVAKTGELIIKANVNSEATGVITFKIINETGDVVLESNETIYSGTTPEGYITAAILVVDNIAKGSYNYTLSYAGDDNFNGFNYASETPINITKSISHLDANAYVNKYGHIVVEVILSNDATGNVTFEFISDSQNLTVDIPVENGTAYYDELTQFAKDNYQIIVTYSGDDNYYSNSDILSAYVTKDQINLTDPVINVDHNQARITLTFPEDVTGNLTAYYLRYGTNETFVMNKTVVLDLIVENGEHTILFTYDGDDNYYGFYEYYAEFFVKSSSFIKVGNVNVVYGNNAVVSVTLTNNDDNKGYVPISGATVTVTVNGKKYTGKTNSAGVASISVPANMVPKTYTGNVVYAGNSTCYGESETFKLTVTKASSKIYAAKKTYKAKVKSKKYTITLKNNKGKAIAKAKVYLKVKGKTYVAKTNSKGKATFKITKLTKKGKYTAKITYGGSAYYNKAAKSVKITVKK